MRRFIFFVAILIAPVCGSCAPLRPAPPVDLYDLPCEEGYQSSAMAQSPNHQTAPELQRIAHTKLCTANPEFCKTNADCQKNYECNFHTQSFVPAGSGVCWPSIDAALGS